MKRLAIVCGLAVVGLCGVAAGDDWPQWLGPRRDAIWRETGILESFPDGGPAVRWRVPVGPGYSGPAVAEGRLFVMDRQPELKEDGTPAIEPIPGAEGRSRLPGKERILCIDPSTGATLWTHAYNCPYAISYPSGPRVTPLVAEGIVYCLGAMGHLKALRADSGEVVWERQLAEEFKTRPPAWGYAAHPLLDGDSLICLVGGEGSAVVAFDKKTGREQWRALTAEEVGYAPPVLCTAGGRQQLIIWLDTSVNGLDPESGKPLWAVDFPTNGPPQRPVVTIMTPQIEDDLLFISNFYDGSAMIRISEGPVARLVWQSDKLNDGQHRSSLNAIMTTPMIIDGYIYGISGDGELRCLKADTGELVWRDVKPTGERRALFATAFLVRHGARLFLFNDQGFLILARISPRGYEELDRAKLLEPTSFTRGRHYVWSHPAFADRAMFARNDDELIRVDLSAQDQ